MSVGRQETRYAYRVSQRDFPLFSARACPPREVGQRSARKSKRPKTTWATAMQKQSNHLSLPFLLNSRVREGYVMSGPIRFHRSFQSRLKRGCRLEQASRKPFIASRLCCATQVNLLSQEPASRMSCHVHAENRLPVHEGSMASSVTQGLYGKENGNQ